jgi:hypothetical protein
MTNTKKQKRTAMKQLFLLSSLLIALLLHNYYSSLSDWFLFAFAATIYFSILYFRLVIRKYIQWRKLVKTMRRDQGRKAQDTIEVEEHILENICQLEKYVKAAEMPEQKQMYLEFLNSFRRFHTDIHELNRKYLIQMK